MAARKKTISKTAEGLAKALTFVSAGIDEGVEVYKSHARIVNGYIVTFNGIMCVGHPIEENELAMVCPHIPTLITAINKSGKKLSLAINDKGNLQVTGENIRAIVPCVDPATMPPVMPDMKITDLSDSIKDGFKALLPLVAEEADRIHEMTVLLRANTMVAVNGQVMFEYYHGTDLPPGMSIFKQVAKTIAQTPEKLIGFGWNGHSTATFWFEGGAFIQARLGDGGWPDVDSVFERTNGEPVALPAGFFDGIEAVAPFSVDGAVHFDADKVRSGYANYGPDGPVYGATYDVPGMVAKHCFSVKALKLIKPVCDRLDYWSNDERALFFGPIANGETAAKIRGVLTKRRA
jgi:hypothetical protein